MLQFFSPFAARWSTLLESLSSSLRSRRFIVWLGFLLSLAAGTRAQSVFVNELIYDSRQLVGGSFQDVVPNLIEIAGPANTNVNSWSLVFYDGTSQSGQINTNNGRVYGSATISGVIPNQQNGYGTLAFTFPPATLQAGSNDGIAIVNSAGTVVQLISYEGSFTAVNGPATGMVAQDIGRSHGVTNGMESLQLQGTGSVYADFIWSPLFASSPGRVNNNFTNNPQVFVAPTTVNLSVSTNTITEGVGSNTIVVTATASSPVVGNQSVRVQGAGTNITGDDFGLRDLTIAIPSGATSGSTVLTIKDDSEVEGTEVLTLTISGPSASIALGTVTTQDITILDNDVPPVLTVTPTALSFSTTQGTPSAQQTYVLSATALTSAITVVAPSGVEVSQVSGAGFANSFTLPSSTTSATVYVRLSATAPVTNAFTGTITNVSGSQTANVAVTGTISVSTSPNQPPVATANANQTATVGVNFSYVVNAFTDPNGDVLTYSASGLPMGLSFDASTRTISGVASASGVSTVSITATDPGNLSASTTFTITVSPAPVTPPANQAPVAVSNPNQTATVGVNFAYQINAFTDPDGDILTYSALGLPAGLSFDASTRTISGVASASGVSTVIITATDPGNLSASTTFTITINPAPVVNPPTPGSFAITGVTTVTCATVTEGLRTLTFTPQYAGTTGQPVTFVAVNEALPTTAPGPYTINLYTDNPTITLKATQDGTVGETVFSYKWLAACGGGSTPPTPGSFAITGVTTVNCEVVNPGLRTLTFAPQYTGTTGQPITFVAVNEALPTTASGPYTLNLYTDNPTITLRATQDRTAGEATFRYNWLAACGGARRGVEPVAALQVRVLGNPVQNTVDVEVAGAQGTALNVSLTDTKGRTVGQGQTGLAGVVERYQFNVSAQPAGVFLLRVSTGSQLKTVRIVKGK